MDLPLKSFELSITWIWDDQQLSARATKIINKIFESSKNSLLKLVIPPLGLLSGLVIPEFENVRILYLSHDESYEDYNSGPAMFPPLFEMAEHFPNLRELTATFLTEDNYFSTYEPLQPMRKVELLRIVCETEYDETLMSLTPNVKTLLVCETGDHTPAMNFKAIAKHLKTLENLGWHIHAESKEDLRSSCALDSVVTGFSTKTCKKLAAKFRKEEDLDQQTVATYDKYRKKTSILKLSALKRFDMSFVLKQDLDETSDSEFICCEESDCDCSAYDEGNRDAAGFYRGTLLYKSCLTKVSQLFAFNLMPDLDVNIINRYTSNKYCSRR
ncbi:hypothetical protein HA402_007788 [Bradysia odoriphaga]|nr:hypothetical protein HA402_007788 [Bradysia odoriphaga]